MTKTYIVAGANWIAEVELPDVENFDIEMIKTEAATRAVEALFKKRFDIPVNQYDRGDVDPEGELNEALLELLTEELEPGCGIGVLLCIMNVEGENTDEHQEWYISSKEILQNVGLPHLVKRYDEKRTIKN
jgi:hypothetical protein